MRSARPAGQRQDRRWFAAFCAASGIAGARQRAAAYTLGGAYVRPAAGRLHHFDLYRLEDAWMRWRCWVSGTTWTGESACYLIEWPEQAGGLLPAADIAVCHGHVAGRKPAADMDRQAPPTRRRQPAEFTGFSSMSPAPIRAASGLVIRVLFN
ncbi:MAG: tRNA (adenosine(37)-N6)-threonylcarbamoyltransferase complex ATPase subunit type 1 TsaE [Gammaproteobacteria bacterium]|nr:tRNA (adenosine(37)-N6)-threonylcarbamoyltransferase complex ATPase subunit type 1 TsaE [Gammaproteobacteria bacterium]